MDQIPTKSPAQRRAAARTEIRLDAWRSVLERTDRIVSGEDVRLRISGAPHPALESVPGWTDGTMITLNRTMLEASIKSTDTVTSVLRLKGLNYHELSHVLYSPRQNSTIARNLLRRGEQTGDGVLIRYAFNALEDQRIETSFAATYSPSRRYFEAMVLKYLVEEGTSEAALLLHGRKYLDANIRVRAEAAFVAKHGQALFDEFADVIDTYLVVQFPTNAVMAEKLIVRFVDLLKRVQSNNGNDRLPKPIVDDQDHQENGAHTSICAGRGVSGRDAKDAAQAVEAMMKQAKADDEKAKAEQGKGSEGDADGDGAEDGAGAGSDAAGDGDADGDGGKGGKSDNGQPDKANSAGQGGIGTSGRADQSAAPSPNQQQEAEDAMSDLLRQAEEGLDDIHNDDDIQEDAEEMMDAVRAVENNGNFVVDAATIQPYRHVEAQDDTKHAVRRVQSIVQQIRASAEPEILRQQTAGRVDARRVLTRRATDTEIFVKYDEGALDETGMEVVLLMDNSGSMGAAMGNACAAMWAMKRSFDRLGIPCTVLIYDTDFEVLYRARDKASGQIPVITTGGGTNPTSALKAALNIFSKSNEPNKVLITVTDGGWGTTGDQDKAMMKSMRSAGVTSLLLGLDGALFHHGKHYHDVGRDLASVAELPKAVSALVAEIMRRALNIA